MRRGFVLSVHFFVSKAGPEEVMRLQAGVMACFPPTTALEEEGMHRVALWQRLGGSLGNDRDIRMSRIGELVTFQGVPMRRRESTLTRDRGGSGRRRLSLGVFEDDSRQLTPRAGADRLAAYLLTFKR